MRNNTEHHNRWVLYVGRWKASMERRAPLEELLWEYLVWTVGVLLVYIGENDNQLVYIAENDNQLVYIGENDNQCCWIVALSLKLYYV